MQTVYTSGQLLKFTKLLEDQDVEPKHFQGVLETPFFTDLGEAMVRSDFAKLDRNAIRQALGLGAILPRSEPVFIEVDLAEDLQDLIATGKYDSCSTAINEERFPRRVSRALRGAPVRFEVKLVEMKEFLKSSEILKHIQLLDPQDPWSAGEIEHLLSFGATFPDEQRRGHNIVALGSVVDADINFGPGVRCVPHLSGAPDFRHVDLGPWDGKWDPADWLFLAVRRAPRNV